MVKSIHPVSHSCPVDSNTPHIEESLVMFVVPFYQRLVGAIAERRIGAEFAVAEFEVSTFRNIEGDWSQSRDQPFALSITERSVLCMSTSAPVVFLSPIKVHMVGE